jgi:Stage III sporulation protein D
MVHSKAMTVMFFNSFVTQVNFNNSQYARKVIKRRQNFMRKVMAAKQLEEAEFEILFHHILFGVKNFVNLPSFRKPRGPNKVRSNEFWEEIVSNHFDDSDWVANFRMRKPTFQLLCDRLRPSLEPSEFSIQLPLSVEKKVAITLYKMASCSEYRVVANQFGVAKSTVHTAFYEVVKAINLLIPEMITMPTPEEVQEIANAYEAK